MCASSKTVVSSTNGSQFRSYRYVLDRNAAGKSAEAEIAEGLDELIQQFGAEAVHEQYLHTDAGALAKSNAQRESWLVNYVLSKAIDAVDTRRECDTMGIATGLLMRQGQSMRDISKKYGCTPAAISKRAREFIEETGLTPSAAMKTEESCHTYSLTNKSRI
jgi:AraC-like DNA-binding protein